MSRPHRFHTPTWLTLGLLLLWLALPAGASATHRGEGVVDEVVIRLSFQSSPVPGVTGQVIAHLAMDDGSAIVGEEVEFLRQVDFLGAREIVIGQATTDVSGDARLGLKPTSQASWRVIARFAGDERYHAAEQVAEIVVPPLSGVGDESLAKDTGVSLAVIAAVMPTLLTATAIAIWLILFGLTAMTVLAIRRGRPSVVRRTEGRSKA